MTDMNNFDLNDFNKNFNRTRRFIYVIWAVSVIGSLAFTGALVWVAWHFLSKVW
jgi:hypothetical protein